MKKRLTIFYSWQSDTPSKLNRSFIEKALTAAINRLQSDATLEPALRDSEVELDKDTQGVAGSPPIAQTILKKIEDCAVFVADLTFIGASTVNEEDVRLIPNPNVLIEYGYALRCHGHGKLIAIMNTAFGASHVDNLPFDLRHLRWPISYELGPVNPDQKQTQYDSLVRRLSDALRLILQSAPVSETPIADFVPHEATTSPELFFDNPDQLFPARSTRRLPEPFTIPNEGRAYMRLYPANVVPAFGSEIEAMNCAVQAHLQPMGNPRGWGHERNIFGGIAYGEIVDGKLYHLTQLFLNREIWGLDSYLVDAESCRAFTQGKHDGYIATSHVEKTLVNTLKNYLKCAQANLLLPLPLRLEVGLVGIEGYPLALANGMYGSVLTDTIQWQGEILSYDMPATEILKPFFAHMWAKCGVLRGDERQAELAREVR